VTNYGLHGELLQVDPRMLSLPMRNAIRQEVNFSPDEDYIRSEFCGEFAESVLFRFISRKGVARGFRFDLPE
jgi:hypothetical protein